MLRRGRDYDPIEVPLLDFDSNLQLRCQQFAATTKLRQIGKMPGMERLAGAVVGVLIQAQNYSIASTNIGGAHLDRGHNVICLSLESVADPFRVQLARVRTHNSIPGASVVNVVARPKIAVDRYELWRQRLRG